MLLKWVSSILTTPSTNPSNRTDQKSVKSSNQKSSSAELIDLVNEALRDDAENLNQVVSSGMTGIERKKLKNRVRSKVQNVISDEFDDPEIVEEVTERIANAAEFDPYYKEAFKD